MPILPDGKIVLNCNYRHTTRSWEIELPRGVINVGESAEDAARRETLEETGMAIDDIIQLGAIPPDSGVVSAVIPIFMAKVVAHQDANREDSEAIEDVLALSVSEIKTAFANGFLELEIRGNPYKVSFRDPFLAYALLMLELKNQ
jgi:ADP-ribose pyrophosphatase